MSSPFVSWAKKIASKHEIPEIFSDFVFTQEPFSYMIYSPIDQWGKRQTNAKLTILYMDRIIILEKSKDSIQEKCFLLRDINFIEYGTILLYSWVCIHGIINGEVDMANVEYNTAVDEIFHPIIKAARHRYVPLIPIDMDKELSHLDFLQSLDYKFWNYSRDVILQGEKIVYTNYQHRIEEIKMMFLKNVVALTHLVILTNYELIVIQDKSIEGLGFKSQSRDGTERIYFPLDKIIKIEVAFDQKTQIFTVTLFLIQETFTLTYSYDKQKEIEVLMDYFKAV